VSSEWFYIRQWRIQRAEREKLGNRRSSAVQEPPHKDRDDSTKSDERVKHSNERVGDVLQDKVVRLGSETRPTLVDDRCARNNSKKSKKCLTTPT